MNSGLRCSNCSDDLNKCSVAGAPDSRRAAAEDYKRAILIDEGPGGAAEEPEPTPDPEPVRSQPQP